MTAREIQVTFDCGDPAALAIFWAEALGMVVLGATRNGRHEPDPPLQGGHIVMADPEGNEFCLD